MVLSKVVSIEYKFGSKEITPIVHIEPVDLDGATIKQVGGHSVKNLIDLEAIPGRYVAITRQGGVIPKLHHKDVYFTWNN